jgi:hypothetical protein
MPEAIKTPDWVTPGKGPELVHLSTMRAQIALSFDAGEGPLGRRTLNAVAKGEFLDQD